MKYSLLALAVTMLLAGCYHATVDTGRTPSTQTLEDRWADSWVYGLVPPDAVATMERCPDGVARVETRLSFLNQLVAALTFGIYTPMEIVVTCATPGEREDAEDAVDGAADFEAALRQGHPFLVDVGLAGGVR